MLETDPCSFVNISEKRLNLLRRKATKANNPEEITKGSLVIKAVCEAVSRAIMRIRGGGKFHMAHPTAYRRVVRNGDHFNIGVATQALDKAFSGYDPDIMKTVDKVLLRLKPLELRTGLSMMGVNIEPFSAEEPVNMMRLSYKCEVKAPNIVVVASLEENYPKHHNRQTLVGFKPCGKTKNMEGEHITFFGNGLEVGRVDGDSPITCEDLHPIFPGTTMTVYRDEQLVMVVPYVHDHYLIDVQHTDFEPGQEHYPACGAYLRQYHTVKGMELASS